MNDQPGTKKDHYHTQDHEWIGFQGAVAYTGICRFKLTGFQKIQEINFNESLGFKKQGEIIATIKYNDYQVEAHMPVDGKVLQVNEELIAGNLDVLLDSEESAAWLALIVPLFPHEREDLMWPKQYQMNHKSKYAKQ